MIIDWNSLDLCLNDGLFWGVREYTKEWLDIRNELKRRIDLGIGNSVDIPKGLRRTRRVSRNCPKCGGEMRHISKNVSGNLHNISYRIVGYPLRGRFLDGRSLD